jgi:ribose transport system substrate-binding protein
MLSRNVMRYCLLLMMLICCSSCGRQKSSKYLVGFSQCNLGEPYRVVMNAAAAAEAGNHSEMEVVYSDAQKDNSKQVADVEAFLRQRVDLLIISPNEAKPLTAVVRKAYEGGTPVLVLDRSVEGDAYTCFIGADNREIGRRAGEQVVKMLQEKGRIVEIKGMPGSPPAIERSEGFREVIRKYPGLEIIHDPVANWERDEGKTQMEIALKAHEKIDLVYAHNDPMAIGAWLATKASNRDSLIQFVGIDALPGPDGGIKAVLDGKLAATFVYPNCGKEAIQIAARILNGEKVPKRMALETALITRENAAQFYKP